MITILSFTDFWCTTLKPICAWALVVWAAIKIIDIILEMIIERVDPSDISWWICRPISFRSFEGIRFPMPVGAIVWIGLIVGAVWGVRYIFM